MTVALVDIALMTFLAIIAVAITQVRDLFAAVVLTGIFSSALGLYLYLARRS